MPYNTTNARGVGVLNVESRAEAAEILHRWADRLAAVGDRGGLIADLGEQNAAGAHVRWLAKHEIAAALAYLRAMGD